MFTVESNEGASGHTVEIELWEKKMGNKLTRNSFYSSDYYNSCDSISDRRTR